MVVKFLAALLVCGCLFFSSAINLASASGRECSGFSHLDVLIDNYNGVIPGYTPSDLVALDNQRVRYETAAQLRLMRADMARLRMGFKLSSGYRSDVSQATLYQQWTRVLGYSTIKRAAPPGFSEHQLGTAVDLVLPNGTNIYPSKTWSWLDLNAHKYGFVLSYRGTQQSQTGFQFEPWHWRYVGVELATKIRYSLETPQKFYRKIAC